MELFYSDNISGNTLTLNEDESVHCVKVLRHRAGDKISVIDGKGALLHCTITSAAPKRAEAEIESRRENWGGHPYVLNMAVCPTKNIDRYEWFVEKACETGVDSIIPIIGDHSERKVVKTARLERILLSAAKQSLKAKIPATCEALSVKDFIMQAGESSGLKLIACCFEDENIARLSIKEVLEKELTVPDEKPRYTESIAPEDDGTEDNRTESNRTESDGKESDKPEITILIGPEGDFSKEEAALALRNGFIPIHLGPSRLRTETAAMNAVDAVYFHLCL